MLSRRERSANCSRSRVTHSGDRDKSSGKSSDERRKAEVRLKSEIHTFMFCFSVSISCKSRLSSSSFAADIPFRCSCFPAISFNVFRESSSCFELLVFVSHNLFVYRLPAVLRINFFFLRAVEIIGKILRVVVAPSLFGSLSIV